MMKGGAKAIRKLIIDAIEAKEEKERREREYEEFLEQEKIRKLEEEQLRLE